MKEDDERETVLYHGTTYDVAQSILSKRSFEHQTTYFSSTRDLAKYFALRACAKRNKERLPAIIRVSLYEADLQLWRQNKLVGSRGFSEGDKPELQGKTQLVFNSDAVRFLNRDMFPDDMHIEQIECND